MSSRTGSHVIVVIPSVCHYQKSPTTFFVVATLRSLLLITWRSSELKMIGAVVVFVFVLCVSLIYTPFACSAVNGNIHTHSTVDMSSSSPYQEIETFTLDDLCRSRRRRLHRDSLARDLCATTQHGLFFCCFFTLITPSSSSSPCRFGKHSKHSRTGKSRSPNSTHRADQHKRTRDAELHFSESTFP